MRDTTPGTIASGEPVSDAELTARIRSGPAPAAESALAELYRRHHASVLSYARSCTRDPYAAEDLASEAFTRTVSAVHRGSGPQDAWRPYLLTAVRREAAAWSSTARRIELAPDFETWLSEAPVAVSGEEQIMLREDRDLVLRAFRRLPQRWQTVLWHSAVEGETPHDIALLLGISPSGVASLTARAREGLREAYLAEYALDGDASEECRHFTAQLAASIRRDSRGRVPRSLGRHLEGCRRCRRAHRQIRDLNRSLGVVLPASVLLWVGGSYGAKTAAAAAAGGGGSVGGSGMTASVTAVGIGAAVLVAGVAGFVLLPDDSDSPQAAPARTSVSRTSQTVTPTPSHPTPSHSPGSRTPTPRRSSATPTARVSNTPSAAAWQPAADGRAQLPIVSTGACMDIPAGEGAEPYEAACDGSRSQQWELLVDRGAQEVRLRNHETGMCLTHTGTSQDGAPVRQEKDACTSSAVTARWTYFLRGDGAVSFAQKNNTGHLLGLDEWNKTNQAHSPAIGTTANYYGSQSLQFRYSGSAFTG